MQETLDFKQREICSKFGSAFYGCNLDHKVGISRNIKNGEMPINGLRIKPEGDTNGWYIWAGEWSNDDDFFVPLHAHHLAQWAPLVLPYLGLEPGWRFLIDNTYEDVWLDAEPVNGRN
jgi:hypothetical protein